MAHLEKPLIKSLEVSISAARDTAEAATGAVLEYLGVGLSSPPFYLTEENCELRRQLRLHALKIGDRIEGGISADTWHLADEIAYEHWHRMFFAKYLFENDLLMCRSGDCLVPVSIGDCDDLARESGETGGWAVAARLAQKMLPQVFREDSPVFRLVFPQEHQQKLAKLLEDLPSVIFHKSDSLMWAYQFWQAKRKREIKESGVIVGDRELPAMTQIFTDSYMIRFLLDNTVGAWWVSRFLAEVDFRSASGEQELRDKAALNGAPLEYLRFVQDGDGSWNPAAGSFDGWPSDISKLTVIDPSCGSGHFLLAAFEMLVPMRMASEGLSARDAADAVLRDNLFGLELDPRCVEIAQFAMSLAAWKYPGGGGYRVLPEINVACSGRAGDSDAEEWVRLACGNTAMESVLAKIHTQFRQAGWLGSLVDPVAEFRDDYDGENFAVLLDDIRNFFNNMFGFNRLNGFNGIDALNDLSVHEEMTASARELARTASMLMHDYTLVATNVPYLARIKQGMVLRDFSDSFYPDSKRDLSTVCLERFIRMCSESGTGAFILPQNFLFLEAYKSLREKLARFTTWHLLASLGGGCFSSLPSSGGASVVMVIVSPAYAEREGSPPSQDVEAGLPVSWLDASACRPLAKKACHLRSGEIVGARHSCRSDGHGSLLDLRGSVDGATLRDLAICHSGITTGDIERYRRCFWEFDTIPSGWRLFQGTPDSTVHYGGRTAVIDWRTSDAGMSRSGSKNFGTCGVALSQMRKLHATIYSGDFYGSNVGAISPVNPEHHRAVWCFCSSSEYHDEVRKLYPKMNVTTSFLTKVPFDLDRWTKIADRDYPDGLPRPYSDDPAQWIFHGHPCRSVVWDSERRRTAFGPIRTDRNVLHVAACRLLGYRWPAEQDRDMELAEEQRKLADSCGTLLSAEMASTDGIVCIPSLRGEAGAESRLIDVLAASYGDAFSTGVMSQLLKDAGFAGKTLEEWLRDGFFVQHCALFRNRPFIWQIWDGLKDGFSALVNCHRLSRNLLENLTYACLGDWIRRQAHDLSQKVDGAEERLSAAMSLKDRLKEILAGDAPHDIFVRWKSLVQHTLEFSPDMADGVRLNIRPFMTGPDVRIKGAGVLRHRPKLDWSSDKGRSGSTSAGRKRAFADPDPWLDIFKGVRRNDYHLKLRDKLKSR
jgi:hypothetical protein